MLLLFFIFNYSLNANLTTNSSFIPFQTFKLIIIFQCDIIVTNSDKYVT